MESIENTGLRELLDNVVTPDLVRLTGFVFDYDNEGVNTTLFLKYLGVEITGEMLFQDFVTICERNLEEKRGEFLHAKEALGQSGEAELGSAFNYYRVNFEKIELFFGLLALYIPIEAQKIKKFGAEEINDIEGKIAHIENIEAQIYGDRLSNRPKQAHITLDYIRALCGKNGTSLDEDEKNFLEGILGEVDGKIPKLEQPKHEQDDDNDLNLSDPLLNIKDINKDILDKEISQEKYVQVFRLAIEILGLDDVQVALKDGISNISVSPSAINIPSNHEDYQVLTVRRIISLIAHELERHAVGNANNKTLIGNLKSLSYLGQEEGVAHIMEHLALGYSLDEMPINRYMPRMLIGELIDGKRFKKFLSIMNKLDGEKIDVETFFRRFKRGKNELFPGVNPKEKLYGIGALEIIDRLRNGENPLGFFLAKNGVGEQGEITEMITHGEGEITPERLSEKSVIIPLMLGELLRYQLLNPEESNKGMLGGFLKYFHDRYGELFSKFGINYKDFIKNHIASQKDENRERVNKILEIFRG